MAHATIPFSLRCLNGAFPQFGAMGTMDAPLETVWVPHGSNFQKAYVEEWEQEVHTPSPAWSISDKRRQERECYREDSHTRSRLANEVSEQEMFASLTCADSWDEGDTRAAASRE